MASKSKTKPFADFDVRDSNLDKIRLLSDSLMFPQATAQAPGFKEHEMECGTSFAWAMLDNPLISVARWFNSNGTEFPEHIHKQTELLYVIAGSMVFIKEGVSHRMMPGDSILVQPNEPHEAKFLEDCKYLAITIPRCDDWPKPEENGT
tara:strand:+ start:9408 stop:9854 length:447 start_codon:yes stop_codon:yes gene_type:complete